VSNNNWRNLHFIQLGHIQLFISDSKDIWDVTKDFYFNLNKCCSFEKTKIITVSTTILSVFDIGNKCFLSSKSSY